MKHFLRHGRVDEVEISQQRREHCIDHAELRTGEIRPVFQDFLKPLQPISEGNTPGVCGRAILGVKELPGICQCRSVIFEPGALPSARQGILRVELAATLCFFEVFADRHALEQDGVFAILALHLQQGHLARHRQCWEPVRFGGEIDVDPFESNAFL